MRMPVNCKDGLNRTQEIQARRLKDKLLDNSNYKEVKQKLQSYYASYSNDSNKDEYQDFKQYLKEKNPVLCSACRRASISVALGNEFVMFGRESKTNNNSNVITDITEIYDEFRMMLV